MLLSLGDHLGGKYQGGFGLSSFFVVNFSAFSCGFVCDYPPTRVIVCGAILAYILGDHTHVQGWGHLIYAWDKY